MGNVANGYKSIVIINCGMKDKPSNLTFISNQRSADWCDWTFSRAKEKKMPLGSFVEGENVMYITNLKCYLVLTLNMSVSSEQSIGIKNSCLLMEFEQ